MRDSIDKSKGKGKKEHENAYTHTGTKSQLYSMALLRCTVVGKGGWGTIFGNQRSNRLKSWHVSHVP